MSILCLQLVLAQVLGGLTHSGLELDLLLRLQVFPDKQNHQLLISYQDHQFFFHPY